MSEKILLKDIFDFDGLLEKYPNRRVKLRFNKNWYNHQKEYYDFVIEYLEHSSDFLPFILSLGDKKKRNQDNDIQFQFIEVEPYKWLFIGAYLIKKRGGQFHQAKFGNYRVKYADAERLKEYDKYTNKVLVNFVNRPKQFFYVSLNIINSVEISSLTSDSYFENNTTFPGYDKLSISYGELKKHIYSSSWREQLSSIYGVYVITDTKTGKMYVGSAYGSSGVYGRWATYLLDGYDRTEVEDSQYPNTKLRELVNEKGLDYIKNNFQYTLLEIFNKTETGKSKALERENYWKNVLQSRKFGYNRN